MSHLVSHLDGAPTNGSGPASSSHLAGLGADASTPGVTALVPAPMPTSQQALVKSVVVVGIVALLAYGACCAVRK